ncbi:MAG: hypothetical protein FWD64_11185 [Acidobacteriaceae bacterium]|nr:hypothetical protein [Acidobacteriaceae bacterium]
MFVTLAALAASGLRAQSLAGDIGVGLTPYAVAVNPVTNMVYVVNRGSGSSSTVAVIDVDHVDASRTVPVTQTVTPPTL